MNRLRFPDGADCWARERPTWTPEHVLRHGVKELLMRVIFSRRPLVFVTDFTAQSPAGIFEAM